MEGHDGSVPSQSQVNELLHRLYEAAGYIIGRIPRDKAGLATPQIGIVGGYGLSDLSEILCDTVRIPFSDIPHFANSTVSGQGNELVFGHLYPPTNNHGQAVASHDGDQATDTPADTSDDQHKKQHHQGDPIPIVVVTGRLHYYEGFSLVQVTFPIRVMTYLHIQQLILLNASGSLDPNICRGDIMVITDHISLPSLAGINVLRGENVDYFGHRFPALENTYFPASRELVRMAAAQVDLDPAVVKEGIYAGVGGPSYETRAELRFLRTIGCSAVGMSTVPEVVVAAHAGIPVIAIALISNQCPVGLDGDGGGGDREKPIGGGHEEVISTTLMRAPNLHLLLASLVFLLKQNK